MTSMTTPTLALPLAPRLLAALHDAGYTRVEHLACEDATPMELAHDTGLSVQEANDVLTRVAALLRHGGAEGNEENCVPRGDKQGASAPAHSSPRGGADGDDCCYCSCGVRDIDRLLGGGFARGCVTELCGQPGSGKTQLAMQLCAHAACGRGARGCVGCETERGDGDDDGVAGARAIYVDTEGSFTWERLEEIAAGIGRNGIGDDDDEAETEEDEGHAGGAPRLSAPQRLDAVRRRVRLCRVRDLAEQLAFNYVLDEDMSAARRQVATATATASACSSVNAAAGITLPALLVIDSVSFLLRASSFTSRLLSSYASQLQALAHRHNLAVVLVNHVTTRIEPGALPYSMQLDHLPAGGTTAATSSSSPWASAHAQLVPALGESWQHACTNRLLLAPPGRAYLAKSSYLPRGAAAYRLGGAGVLDVDCNEEEEERARRAWPR